MLVINLLIWLLIWDFKADVKTLFLRCSNCPLQLASSMNASPHNTKKKVYNVIQVRSFVPRTSTLFLSSYQLLWRKEKKEICWWREAFVPLARKKDLWAPNGSLIMWPGSGLRALVSLLQNRDATYCKDIVAGFFLHSCNDSGQGWYIFWNITADWTD